MLQQVISSLIFSHTYTRERAVSVPFHDWFTIPPNGISNIAWQIGHLAFAQYRLCLERLRPRSNSDELLISDTFLKTFGKDSAPLNELGFSAEEILAVFDRVHAQVLAELPQYPEADFDLPVLKPHPLFSTRLQSLQYAPLHEMIHCGQIALIRRMLGHKPIW